jgi:hypothetical protein
MDPELNFHPTQFNDNFAFQQDSDDEALACMSLDLIGTGRSAEESNQDSRKFQILRENRQYIQKFKMTAKNLEIKFLELNSADVLGAINESLNDLIQYLTQGMNLNNSLKHLLN